MKILLITPTRGESPWLAAAVASVAPFRPGVIHVLAAPAPVVSTLASRFPDLTVIPESGSGMYCAINGAVRRSPDGDFVGYLNDDDLLTPDFQQILAAAAKGDADVVYGNVDYIDAGGRNLGPLPVANPYSIAAVLARGRAAFTQQGTLVKRELWNRLDGMDEHWRMAADCDLWCRCVLAAARFRHVSAVVAAFRLHGAQLSADRSAMERELAAVHARHRSALQSRARWGGAALFQFGSLPGLARRRWSSGLWTSRALYARHALKS